MTSAATGTKTSLAVTLFSLFLPKSDYQKKNVEKEPPVHFHCIAGGTGSL